MKHLKHFIWIGMMLLFAAAGCATPTPVAPVASPVAYTAVMAEGHIYPAQDTTLFFLTRGTVNEVLVEMGEEVDEGQPLIQLAHSEVAQAELEAAQQAYHFLLRNADGDRAAAWLAYMDAQKVREKATKRWNDINLRNIENRIEDRQEDLADELEDLKKAQEKFEKYRDRGRDDANYKNAENDLEDAQAEYDDAVKDLESTMRERDVPHADLDAALAAEAEAKYQYELGLDGPNADQLALLETRLAAAEDALSNYVLSAPFDGAVMDVNVSPGEQVGLEIYALKFADTSDWYVETSDLSELDVVDVEVGEKVIVTPDALPNLELLGVVESIDLVYTERSGDILYTVRIRLEEFDPLMRWGMTVTITFGSSED
jgi:multidrug efflux pump subunit AcrA (membrane-fusion protein)